MPIKRKNAKKPYQITQIGSFDTVDRACIRVSKNSGLESSIVKEIVRSFFHELKIEIIKHKRFYIPGLLLFQPRILEPRLTPAGKDRMIMSERKRSYVVKLHPLVTLALNPKMKQNQLMQKLIKDYKERDLELSLYSRKKPKKGE